MEKKREDRRQRHKATKGPRALGSLGIYIVDLWLNIKRSEDRRDARRAEYEDCYWTTMWKLLWLCSRGAKVWG